jgi:hypothetical protein
MFWGRTAAFERLTALGPEQLAFEPEMGRIDGTTAHALERSLAAGRGCSRLRGGLEPLTNWLTESRRGSAPRASPAATAAASDGTETALQFLEYAPEAPAPSTPMLLAAEDRFVGEKIRSLHSPDLRHGNVHALGRFVVEDLTVAGDGLLIHAGALLEHHSLLPDYVRRVVSDSDVASELSKPVRVIEGPLVVFMGHGPYVYGHVLLEMLPRVQLLCAATGRRPPTSDTW